MKFIETMDRGENLGWCKPYVDASGEYVLVRGESVTIRTPDGVTYDPDAETMERFARTVNPDYDLFSGYDDVQIAVMGMTEVGCTECPFRDECDPMQEEIEEDEEE